MRLVNVNQREVVLLVAIPCRNFDGCAPGPPSRSGLRTRVKDQTLSRNRPTGACRCGLGPAERTLRASPDFVPEHLRASGVGWYNTTVGLAGLIASIVAGLLWDDIGHWAVFLYGAAFAGAGCIALAVLIASRRD